MRTLLVLLLLALAPVASAQQPGASLDPALMRTLASDASAKTDAVLHLLVRGDASSIRAAVEAVGGSVETTIGDISTVRLPASQVGAVAQRAGVTQIEQGARYRTRNDSARVVTGVARVHAGQSPLTQAYTGEGVIVGIIDSGIDFRHRDFRDADDPSKSRIVGIWDQNTEGTPPAGYSYGSYHSRDAIEDDLAGTATADHEDADGHGTHVAGSAAGNGAAIGRHGGMAPDAELLVVAIQEPESQEAFAAALVDAAAWIYQMAEAMGRPAVINASLGSHDGPHDGSSLDALALDALLAGQNSQGEYARAFVAAAGNEGSDQIHWSYELSADTSWTWRAASEANYFMTIRGAGYTQTTLTLAADAVTSETTVERGPVVHLDLMQLITSGDVEEIIFEDADGNEVAGAEIAARRAPAGHLEVSMYWEDDGEQLDDGSYANLDLLRIALTGQSATVHMWSEESVSPEALGLTPNFGDGYWLWDNDYSVGLPAVARHVIAVGAATNIQTDAQMPGERALFSSRGPTTDGRTKPEIVAPGENVASSLSFAARDSYAGRELEGGQHVYETGTSMASPVAAGAVALYLQARPRARIDEIRAALMDHALSDDQTGAALPDNDWGWGKLDIFAALSNVATSTERLADLGTIGLSQAQPHPVRSQARIAYQLEQSGEATLALYDALGRRVAVLAQGVMPAGTHTAEIDASQLPSGLYLLRLSAQGRSATQAVTVVR
jgi:subtilisin family serine protease